MSKKKQPSSHARADEKREAEDVFVEKTLETIRWAKDNSQTLLLVGIVLVVLMAGAVWT